MFCLRRIVLLLIICTIKIIKCQEISSTTESNKENSESSTAYNINSSTLENLLITSSTLPSLEATNHNLNTLKNYDSSTSWELIYPDQNSTTTMEPLSTSSVASAVAETTATLPKYLRVDDVLNCQKYFGQCLSQVLAKVLPKLKNGHQQLGLPRIDPIHFNQTTFKFNNGPFTGYITIRSALIYGLTNMKFKKVDYFGLANKKFKAHLSTVLPKVEVIGTYKGDLKVNNIAVRPRGDFNVTITGVYLIQIYSGEIYEENDHKFLRFTKNNITTTLKDSKINATGIFPDQRLNDIVLNVANQYWRDLFNIVLPETRNYWSPIILDALNGVLAMVPFDFLT